MEQQNKKKIFCKQNIPNILVVVRMVLAVFVALLVIANHYTKGFSNVNPVLYHLHTPSWLPGYYVSSIYLFFLLAGCLFVLACITDWLDGYLARKYNWVSDFGKLWDPIADKVLVNSVLICFAWSGYVCILIPVIMIARDVMVDAQKMVAAKKGVVVAANFWVNVKLYCKW